MRQRSETTVINILALLSYLKKHKNAKLTDANKRYGLSIAKRDIEGEDLSQVSIEMADRVCNRMNERRTSAAHARQERALEEEMAKKKAIVEQVLAEDNASVSEDPELDFEVVSEEAETERQLYSAMYDYYKVRRERINENVHMVTADVIRILMEILDTCMVKINSNE